MSERIQEYFKRLDSEIEIAYALAKKAKAKGLDPSNYVEIPSVKNMAEKVEGLISVAAPQIVGKGIPERIQELEKEYGKLDWRVALSIALEIAKEKFCKFNEKKEAMEVGVRVGFAYLTLGTVASPLEGFIGINIRKRRDGKEYLALSYAGPVRSAGGTGASTSVLIADYIRKNFGYSKYDPTEKEIKRSSTEVRDYHERITNLQYFPSDEETEFLTKNMPVQIDGEPTEKFDVSNYKDLDRIDTNKIRGGFALMMGECLALKAPKILKQLNKWGNDFGFDDWKFMGDFVNLQKNIKAKSKKKETEDDDLLKEDHTFIKDIVAGRPVLTYPMRPGGFRLRYGRGRNTGLSSTAINPLTMNILDGFVAVGTQFKMERPGKSTVLGSCDTVEGPIVKLKNGSVVFIEDLETCEKYKDEIKEILFLGDILINYGDFLDRAHVLVPPGYCEEWWIQELKRKEDREENFSKEMNLELPYVTKIYDEFLKVKPTIDEAFKISKKYKIPLHPRYTLHWKDIEMKDFLNLLNWLNRAVIKKEGKFKVIFPLSFKLENADPKRILELIGVPHSLVSKEYVLIEDVWAKSFMANLGFLDKDLEVVDIIEKIKPNKSVLELINEINDIKIKDKSGLTIGARMGRPEKAKLRKLTGSPHVLFPVGEEGGRLRCFASALESGRINAEFPLYYCDVCQRNVVYPVCDKCNEKTNKIYYCNQCKKEYAEENCEKHGRLRQYKKQELPIIDYFDNLKNKLDIKEFPQLIKGVRGTSNQGHIPENLMKGVLRAVHEVYVNKDGTIRYDMTELPLTHFVPNEIGTTVKKLKDLGYNKDIYGVELTRDDQILELKPQDIVLPSCDEGNEEGADKVLFRVANFIDDLLEKFYGIEKFYNLKEIKDLTGCLVIGLAPHTSAGILGRVIGFSKTQGCYAHPLWHSAQRRDCDGDETCVMLLMDGLLNFSRKYLPGHRGATQDAPLVLSSKLIPSEVDDMVFNMDMVWSYPLEFYKACEKFKMPWEVKIKILDENLDTPEQYEKYGFTHGTSNINSGIVFSSYKRLPTMGEKVLNQMKVAEKIRAVDEHDVARLVIERHFIRDIRGNLRKFSMQQFRCVKCNEKYRRPPLLGNCLKCNGKIIFTISEGSVIKYLEPSLSLARKYKIPSYLKQNLELTKSNIESVFGKEKESQKGLGEWFG